MQMGPRCARARARLKSVDSCVGSQTCMVSGAFSGTAKTVGGLLSS